MDNLSRPPIKHLPSYQSLFSTISKFNQWLRFQSLGHWQEFLPDQRLRLQLYDVKINHHYVLNSRTLLIPICPITAYPIGNSTHPRLDYQYYNGANTRNISFQSLLPSSVRQNVRNSALSPLQVIKPLVRPPNLLGQVTGSHRGAQDHLPRFLIYRPSQPSSGLSAPSALVPLSITDHDCCWWGRGYYWSFQ